MESPAACSLQDLPCLTHCSVLYMLYLSSHLLGLSLSVPSPEKLSLSTLTRHIPSPLVL